MNTYGATKFGKTDDKPYESSSPVAMWSDKSLLGAVCHVGKDGVGPIMCSKRCENYDGCEIGKEYVKRGLAERAPTPRKTGPKKIHKTLQPHEIEALECLHRIRLDMDMSRQEFADACHVSVSSVNGWEQHRALPTMSLYLDVVHRFGYEMKVGKKASE